MSPRRHQYSEVVTYSQAHLRLKTDRGRADSHACAVCGGVAREWAYTGGCVNELDDGKHGKYSLNQSLYEPMCAMCHHRLDRALADGRSVNVCPKGHEWTPENTGIRVKRAANTGLRFCKACNREHSRKYRLRLLKERAA